MKIAIPVTEKNGLESRVSSHFGHVSFFFVYDTNDKSSAFFECEEHEHERCTPVDVLVREGVAAVFVHGIGSRAIEALSELGLKALTGPYSTVREVISNLPSLKSLEEGCGH
ncbi:MAG: NifB/NifX family molybdenum-iron cluster-binding protein [Candidatus Diapherotrites archaeon]|nr:NifB/NifX family molybdenum-iron cluster-binding protein [Candidatus Diapherotrites archaeon]